MTEAQWQHCTDPLPMLEWLAGKRGAKKGWLASLFASSHVSTFTPPPISPRKLRLFACACCSPIWDLLAYPESRDSVEVAEQFADGAKSASELEAAHWAAVNAWDAFQENVVPRAIMDPMPNLRAKIWAAQAGAAASLADAEEAAVQTARAVVRVAEEIASWDEYWAACAARAWARSPLLREIVGNPFRPVILASPVPSSVVRLAESLYAGEECSFALADALLEAGHAELAEHFRHERAHPKGCFATDLILERE
jgi:hypothetical protein